MLGVYVGIALVSGAALLYEIALTRIFAVAQGYHFGFLAVSLALLGLGASGTVLALGAARARRANRSSLGPLALVFSVSLVASYLVANYLPFDAYRVAWEPVQLVYLTLYLLALVVPFLLAGLLQSLPLILWPDQTATLYSSTLMGSGLGCLSALVALNWSEGPGAVVIAALVGVCAAIGFAFPSRLDTDRGRMAGWVTRWCAIAAIVLLTSLFTQKPAWLDVRLSPYRPLSQILNYPDTRLIYHGWNAFSRVDVLDSPTIRSAPGLSLAYTGSLPPQIGVVVEAENILALTSSENPSPGFYDALPMSLPYYLRPKARALVIEPGGGLDVHVALNGGAESVLAVEKNPLIVELMQGQYADRAGDIYEQRNVRVTTASGRDYAARSGEQFDVVELALSENFRAVSAGAFTLSEDYLMTTEAFRSYLARLAPNGLLAVQRWLQLPPTEEVRAAALVVAALQQSGIKEAGQHIVAIRSFSTMLILARREPFKSDEIAQIKAFSRTRQFDLVYYPGIQPAEANRFNVLQRDLYFESFQALLGNQKRFYAEYEYEVKPPTDDHPFFFNFFKWEQTPTVLGLLGRTWQPFGGGGFLILLVLLGLVLVLSAGFILLPVAIMRRKQRADHQRRWSPPLIYFAALGLGFLFVEIPLIQRFILFLDYPVYALTVVIFGLLMSSGIGSLFAGRLPWRAILVALIVAIGVYSLLLPDVLALFLGQDFTVRVIVAVLTLVPLGFLLGIPFPCGLRRLTGAEPGLVPLAWGVNGFMSVVSSILATLIALSWGFSFVSVGAAAAYALALATIRRH